MKKYLIIYLKNYINNYCYKEIVNMIYLNFLMQGYTVGVAGQTVNLLSLDSGSATLSPCTILRSSSSVG